MSSHGPVINEEGLRHLGRNVSRLTQGILLAVGVVSTVFTLAGEYSHGHDYLQNWLVDNVAIMGALMHLLLVLLILFPGRLRKLNEDVSDSTVHYVTQCLNRFFIPAWTWIWVCFGLLYAVYLFHTMHPEVSHSLRMDHTGYQSLIREKSLMDIFNIGSTMFIACIYSFLTPSFLRRYVQRARKQKERRWMSGAGRWVVNFMQGRKHVSHPDTEKIVWTKERRNAWVPWGRFRLIVFLIAVLAVSLLWIRMNLLWFNDPGMWERLIELSLGFSSAIALAAFAGRIDSHFIRNWQWVIPFLFLYAAIQSYTSVLYDDVRIDRAVFTYAAFTLKCLLFIFVSNFFEGQKSIYYGYEIVDMADKRTL